MILGMSIVTVVVLTVVVLPRFKTFFKSLNAKLPLPTRMLLGVTGFVTTWWFVIARRVLGAFVVGRGIAHAPVHAGRARLDAIVLKLPVAGDLVRHAILERICRILASMIRAGVVAARGHGGHGRRHQQRRLPAGPEHDS